MIGYNEALSARTARKAHHCADGHGCTIRPGHRYVRWVAFPGHDAATTGRPVVREQCIGHAMERDEDADWVAAACGSYCCSVEPCALPASHRGDHSCRNCPPLEVAADG